MAYKNIPLGEKLLSFSFDGKTYPTENINYVTSESLNSISTSISNIEFGNSVWGGTVSATFQGAQNEDLPARLYKGSSSLTVQIPDGNVKDKKVNQTVLWQLFKNATSGERLDYVKTTTEYSFKMTDHLVDSVVLKTWNNRPAENGPDGFDFDFRVERPFTLFDGTVYFLPIVTFLNQVAYTANSFRYRPNMELALSIQTSGGSIDRVNAGESFYAFRDNFRSGTKYSVQVAGRWAGKAENTSQPQFFARGVLTSFPIKLNFFNPSFRILGIISTDERVWFNRTSSSDPWKIASSVDEDYSYSYNSYSFNEFTFSVEGLNDLLRGVLLKNTAVQNGGFSANTVLVGNINLTSAFLNFEDMGHTYLSPFYDFALFVTDDDVNYIHSVGLEFVAIVDSHPAYPLRVSLGFNADDLSKALSGEESELEHEIFIGMGWFF